MTTQVYRQLVCGLAPNAIACAARVIYKHTIANGQCMLTNDAHMLAICDYGDDLYQPVLLEGRGLITPHDVP